MTVKAGYSFKVDPAAFFTPPDWVKAVAPPTYSRLQLSGAKVPLEPIYFNILNGKKNPGLVLLVNPRQLSLSSSKMIREVKTRQGWVHDHWGDNLDQISASGTTAGFIINKGSNPGSGLTTFYRSETLAYANIKSLELLYRNNGYNLLDVQNSPYTSMGSNIISTVGQVMMSYVDKVWVGRFDAFSIEESADKPFTFDWNFSFTVHEQGPAWKPQNVWSFLLSSMTAKAPENPTMGQSGVSKTAVGSLSNSPLASSTQTPEQVASQQQQEQQSWSQYQQSLIGDSGFAVSTPVPTVGVDSSLGGAASCGVSASASYDDYVGVQSGLLPQSEVTAKLSGRLDFRAAKNVWLQFVQIQKQRKIPGLTPSALYSRYDYASGLVDISDLVSEEPKTYSVCPLTQVQFTQLGGML